MKNKRDVSTTDAPRINGDPVVQVRLSEVAEPKRTELIDEMLVRQAKARELQRVRGTGGIAQAQPLSEDDWRSGRARVAERVGLPDEPVR